MSSTTAFMLSTETAFYLMWLSVSFTIVLISILYLIFPKK